MTDTTVFSATPAEPAPQVIPPQVVPQELSELVGQGKKYATVEDALKSVPHAQKHIATIEDELKTAKEELAKRKTTEALLEELKQAGIAPQTQTVSAITTEQVTQLINQSLTQVEVKKVREANVGLVISSFTNKFGEKAEETFKTLAKENDLSIEEFNKLAETSPKAVLKLAGINVDTKPTVVTKPIGDVNTQAITPAKDGELSAKVAGNSTKDLLAAWKVAKQKVAQQTT